MARAPRLEMFMHSAKLGTAVPGVAAALASDAENLDATARRLGRSADQAAAREGELAGTQAALDGKPGLRNSGSIYGEAYDRAAMATYANALSLKVVNEASAVAEQAGSDVPALTAGFDQLRERLLADDVIDHPIARAAFETQFGRIRMAAERRAGKQAARLAQVETRNVALDAIGAERANLRMQASAYGMDEDGLAATEAAAVNTKDVVERNVAQGALTAAQGRALKGQIDADRISSHVMGAFSDLDDDDARRSFVDQLEDDYATGKGIARTLPENQFRRLWRDLDRRTRDSARASARADAEERASTEKAGIALAAEGKLDRAWLEANEDRLGVAAYRRFDKVLSRPPGQTEPGTYGLLLLQAGDDPQGAMGAAFEAYRAGRLDHSAFNKIYGASMRAESEGRPAWLGELRRDLLTRLQPGERQSPREAVRQLDAGEAFEDWVASNPQATPEQARDTAQALAERYRGAATRNERNELPMPRFAAEPREKMGVEGLRAAAMRLRAAIDAGELTETEQRAEVETLRRWSDLLQRDAGGK